MAVKRIDDKDFYYIVYKRESAQDFDLFKKVLTGVLALNAAPKDIVVDFTGCTILSSSEIGQMVRVSKTIERTSRKLMLILSPELREMLDTTNVARSGNMIIYNDKQSFFDMLEKRKK